MRKAISIILCLFLSASGWPMGGRLQKSWSFKPPVGTQINWGHPLSRGLIGCWLFNEGVGPVINDLVTPRQAVVQTPRPGMWAIDGSQGTALVGANQTGTFAVEPFYTVPFPVTVVAIVRSTDLTATQPIKIFAHTDAGGTFNNGFQLFSNGSNPSVLTATIGGAGGPTSFSNLTISKNNTNYFIAWVAVSGNGSETAYLGEQGKALTSQTGTMSGNMGTPTTLVIMGDDATSISFTGGNGHLSYLLYYNRVLSSVEINQLNTNPYVLFALPPANNTLWFPSPATTGIVLPSMNMLGIGGQL